MPQDINVQFCRILLRQVQQDVDKIAQRSVDLFREGSTCKMSSAGANPYYEFTWKCDRNAKHPEGTFRWEGEADNAYNARYEGFCAWLRSKGHKDY